ncbi:MAG: ABC transporter permease [Paraclostridium sp.]
MVMIKNAIENIKTNKLKVIVALIWIVLGITSVVVVDSIGKGMEEKSKTDMESEKYRKQKVIFYENYESVNTGFSEPFTQSDIDNIATIKGIERVIPVYGQASGIYYGASIASGNYNDYLQFSIVNKPENLDIRNGRGFSEDDLNRKTVVIPYYTANKIVGEEISDILGESVNIHGESFEVIGVLEERGDSYDMNDSENQALQKTYIPEQAIKAISEDQSFGQPISELEILVAKGEEIYKVSELVSDYFKANKSEDEGSYSIAPGDDNASHELYIMQDTLNRFTKILSNVSLMIGGIGIMNIMYMAVAERQREIGIRRAIGAEPKDILMQFVIETVFITIIGGIVGSIVGTITALYVGSYLNIPAIPSIAIYSKAIVVSILVGVVFGSIPAYKASRLDPIKAIQG